MSTIDSVKKIHPYAGEVEYEGHTYRVQADMNASEAGSQHLLNVFRVDRPILRYWARPDKDEIMHAIQFLAEYWEGWEQVEREEECLPASTASN